MILHNYTLYVFLFGRDASCYIKRNCFFPRDNNMKFVHFLNNFLLQKLTLIQHVHQILILSINYSIHQDLMGKKKFFHEEMFICVISLYYFLLKIIIVMFLLNFFNWSKKRTYWSKNFLQFIIYFINC